MEWLAFELVAEAQRQLMKCPDRTRDRTWGAIATELATLASTVELKIGFAPHKMRLIGDELETSARGAGERVDVLLLAWTGTAESPRVIAEAYHTTNVPPATASMKRDQPYPESRILWRSTLLPREFVEQAANNLLRRHKTYLSTSDVFGPESVRKQPRSAATVQ